VRKRRRKKVIKTTIAAVSIALLCGVSIGQALEPERIKSKHGHVIVW
jgi:hypothetical protein